MSPTPLAEPPVADARLAALQRELDASRAECAALRASLAGCDARFEAAVRLSQDWFWELDARLRFTRCTGGIHGEDLAGLLVGRAPWELPATVPVSGEWDDLHALLESGQPFADFVCVTRALGRSGERHIAFCGEAVVDPQGTRTGWHGIARDVTQSHRTQERLRRLAHRDRLTGLLNRAATESALQQRLEDAAHDGLRVHVMFVDLDGFKAVNDRLGHAAGDRVLQESAQRLRGVLRDEDVLGRFGGDEFVVVLSEPPGGTPGLADRLCARMRAAMDGPIAVDGADCRLGASIGVAVFPDDAADMAGLLALADADMYEAKRARRAAAGASRLSDGPPAARAPADAVRPAPERGP